MDQISFLKLDANAVIPTRKTEGAAGYDLSSLYDVVLLSDERKCIQTGIAINLPEVRDGFGYYAQIKGRSSLELAGIDAKAGVIDADYRGEIFVLLKNDSGADFFIKAGDRIAQMIMLPFAALPSVEIDELTTTYRGCGGFGSTSDKK